MNDQVKRVKLSQIVFDEAVYPRKAHDPALVAKYADCIENIEAAGKYISVATDYTLLDGKHRWLAYRTAYGDDPDKEIPVIVHQVTDTHAKFALAVELNSAHGYQLTMEDKKSSAKALYAYGYKQETIAKMLSVGKPRVNAWLARTIKENKEKQNRKIWDMWLACYTETQIGEAVNLAQPTVHERVKELSEKFRSTFPIKVLFREEAWAPPIYNVWKTQDKTNAVDHFGNSEERWVENLVYLYTEPLEVVIDPFAGGGGTIDICKRRGRRYWVADRKPIVGREDEIRKADITDGAPSYLPWGDVGLLFLDPPYWKQAANQYSQDPQDLANMPIEEFYSTLVGFVEACASKMRTGSRIALMIQPTQWKAEGRRTVDHVIDLIMRIQSDKLRYERRIFCPYESQQCTAQQVTWAKENRDVLVISREIIIWQII